MKPATATATKKDERYELEFMPFMATTDEEHQLHSLVRRMLHYHILRVQIEDCKPSMTQGQRAYAVQMATRARVQGFQIEREAIDAGIRIDYDDELLRQEATRIAYAINRGEIESALAYEEEVVTLVITRSLYGFDSQPLRIAA